MQLGLGLGLERIGMWCVGAPLRAAAIILLVSIAAAFGTTRINVDDSLTELFRADTPEFKAYEQLSERFPSSEYDILVVIEGEELLTPEALETVRSVILELNFVEAVKGMISLFSAREPPDETGFPPALIPADLPEGAEFEQLRERILKNQIIKGKLLSADGQLALVVLGLDQEAAISAGLREVVAEIQNTVAEILEDSGLQFKLSGAPVMQLEIRNAVQRDRLVYNGLGFLLGALICLISFRSLKLTLIAAAAPAMAILWALGLLGWMDYRLNLFLNIISPLIMVIAFSDSMHMVFDTRRQLMAGDDRFAAARHAVSKVGPACVMTSLTTSIALLSLILADSALIRTFAVAAALATGIAFVAVITLVPTLSVLLLRREEAFAKDMREHDWAMQILNRAARWIGGHVAGAARAYAALGLVLAVLCGAAYLALEPRYRLADQVPDREQAIAASNRLDEKLTGANPIHVMIDWKGEHPLYSDETLAVVSKVNALIEGQAGIGNVWSLETLRKWLIEAGDPGVETLKKYVGLLPKHLTERFIMPSEEAVVVTGRIPDIDASQLLPVIKEIDAALKPIRAQHPDYRIQVTGLSAIAARNSADMIKQLSIGLLSTVAVVVLLLAVSFRSVMAGVVSIVPNLIPIFAAGTLLYFSGEGLQFASAIALTVAFGLAIDNTIHYVHRLRLEEHEPQHDQADDPITRTTALIGPVLMLTTIVLVFGLAVTVFSDLPSLRLFGRLSAVTLGAALFGAVVVLPASVFVARNWVRGHTK